MAKTLVLVTGASGFIGIHCVKALLDAGYKVRGTVRSLENEFKTKPILDLDASAVEDGRLELVEADLMSSDGWLDAVNGCDFVFHVASPVDLGQPKDRNELIKPAVEGTLNVLRACAKTPSVKRVVCTSSVAAITTLRDDVEEKVFTEADWLDPSYANTSAYKESKMRAEKSAWEFVDNLKARGDHQFEFVTICPGFVLGPLLHDVRCMSADIIRQLLMHEIPFVPRMHMGTADVRDVALAHIRAMEMPEAAGKRFICVNEQGWMDELVAQHVAQEFGPQGYWVPTWRCPYFVVWVSSLFSETARMALPYVGKIIRVDNSRIKEVLGMKEMIGSKQSSIEMGYSLIERGIVPKTNK